MSRQFTLFPVLVLGLSLAISATRGLAADAQLTSAPIDISPAELRIRKGLEEKTSLEFVKTPLIQVLEYIKDKHHLEVHLDEIGLKDAKIDPAKTLVTMNVKDVALRSALNLILTQQNLAWLIKDEALIVTTQDQAASMLETRLYDVRDLVVQDYDRGGTPDFDSLIDVIRTTVNPPSWDKSGGQGSVTGFANNGVVALVVWQNYEGQEQVENLLARLRMLKPQRPTRQ